MAQMGRTLPQAIQEKGREIRTFMPKWGNVNERRNQLHEVIRLSGMNLIIDDTDHPLIIKVASIQAARMQVYFIDNDDYFQHRLMATDENGVEYTDNDERAIFYARGVLETVKKLRWCPDIIHCQGWISAFVPLYIKKAYKEEPSFRRSIPATTYFPLPLSRILKPFMKEKSLCERHFNFRPSVSWHSLPSPMKKKRC
jgi:starch synthase